MPTFCFFASDPTLTPSLRHPKKCHRSAGDARNTNAPHNTLLHWCTLLLFLSEKYTPITNAEKYHIRPLSK